MPFLNQQKEKWKYMAGQGIEPGTSGSWVGHATDYTGQPGLILDLPFPNNPKDFWDCSGRKKNSGIVLEGKKTKEIWYMYAAPDLGSSVVCH